MGRSKRSPDGQRMADRRARVASLRREGKTIAEIADIVGYSERTIARDLDDARAVMDELTAEHMEAMRAAHLDDLQRTRAKAFEMVEQLAECPDTLYAWSDKAGFVEVDVPRTYKAAPALQVVLKTLEREAKLLGLDAPEKVEHAGRIESLTETEAFAALVKVFGRDLAEQMAGVSA